jgi:CelD/BcsL family acetyltransferase involved in cellulose biosynthesis
MEVSNEPDWTGPMVRSRLMLDCVRESDVLANRAVNLQLRVELAQGPDAFARLSASWQQLHEQLSPRTPFTSPLWHTLWWKHYRSQRFSVRDELRLYTVRDRSNELIAVAPMMITERPSVGPLRVRILQCLGADRNVTEIRSLVYRPEHQGQVLQSLVQYFAANPVGWDWVDWGVFREDTWADDVKLLPGVICDRQLIDYQLFLPRTWEEFRSTRSRNVKESLRKCYNSLKRAGLAPALQVVGEPEECAAALKTFARLHAERARAVNTVTHPDVFRAPQDRGFLGEYALEMAKRGQLRIFQLHISGQIVATRIGFLMGNELYLYYSGYSTEWAKFSVMTTLLAETLKWAIDQRIYTVNLSTGSDVSKLRWSPTPVVLRSALQIAPAARARLAFGTYRRFRSHPTLKKLLALAGR